MTSYASDVNHNSVYETERKTKRTLLVDNLNSIMRDSVTYVTSSIADLTSSCVSLGDDSVFNSTSYEEDVRLTTGICRDYICYRLKRDGFGERVTVTEYAPAQNHTLSNKILNLGSGFERMFPKSFRQISRQIGYVFSSEATVRRLYFRMGVHIMGVVECNYTWGRILSLLGLAGAMAVDCISQGHPELAESMIGISSDFIRRNTLDWIIRHGGWGALVDNFSPKPLKSYWSTRNILKWNGGVTLAVFVLLFALMLAILPRLKANEN
ncbi:bcl-2-related ovarian killer protein [Ciona intestinalis]